MSRLPSVTPREMVRVLLRAGFVEHHQRGSHLYLWNESRERMTSVSMHAKDLKRGTLHVILKQAGFSEDEFRDLL